MYLYHGTPQKFNKPSLEKCKPHRDFGRGFYLAQNYFDAVPMAIKHGDVGYVHTYVIDKIDNLSVIELPGYSDRWLELVVGARLGIQPNVDLVIGNMAGGGTNLKSKFSKLRNAKTNVEEAVVMMKDDITHTNLGVQYCFLTQRALSGLELVDTEIIERDDIYDCCRI